MKFLCFLLLAQSRSKKTAKRQIICKTQHPLLHSTLSRSDYIRLHHPLIQGLGTVHFSPLYLVLYIAAATRVGILLATYVSLESLGGTGGESVNSAGYSLMSSQSKRAENTTNCFSIYTKGQ